MNEINSKLNKSIFYTLIYAAITLFAVLHHETWSDEAQVWMICEHLSVSELFAHLHNEGHPSLFYLLNMPFAKLSSNIIWMQLICWFSMCLSAFWLIYKSNFPNIVKFAILSSSGFLYFLPVIARNYSIIPILIFLAAYLYSKRKEKPILYAISLFFLANTHAIMSAFVGLLVLTFTIETIKERTFTKKNIISILIMSSGLLALFLQLYNTTSSNCFINVNTYNILKKIFTVVYEYNINAYGGVFIKDIPFLPNCIFILYVTSFILLLTNLFQNSKKVFSICAGSILFQLLIYIFVYGYSNVFATRIFSGLIILIFSFWILYDTDNFNNAKFISSKTLATILLSIFFLLTSIYGIHSYIQDIQRPYDNAKNVATYIKDNISKDSIIIIDNEFYLIALAYYLQDYFKLYSAVRGKFLDYIVWDKYQKIKYNKNVLTQICKEAKEYYKNIYVIQVQEASYNPTWEEDEDANTEKDSFTKIYEIKNGIFKYDGYTIYHYID